MAKKTLEEKIKQVGFWTFGGVFWYLAIAFFLKSNYPIYDYDFNRSVAYDVIKDALTLVAALLAPVAAFVLFTDWREQHAAIKNERTSEEIKKQIMQIKGYLSLGTDYDDISIFFKNQAEFYGLLLDFKRNIELLRGLDEESESYINILLKIELYLRDLWPYYSQEVTYAQLAQQQSYKGESSDPVLRHYMERLEECSQNKFECRQKIYELETQLKILHVK